mmetsp:Transcript_527/g.794  ORF Transcript_527/g.794 Transcript_527/m.794 type:complete len:214 (+) Transcript_527:47-688(+)
MSLLLRKASSSYSNNYTVLMKNNNKKALTVLLCGWLPATTNAFSSVPFSLSPTTIMSPNYYGQSVTDNNNPPSYRNNIANANSRLFSSVDGPTLANVGLEEMKEIVDDYEQGRDDSGYIVMDVREYNEVQASGKISPHTETLPLSIISQQQVFEMDPEDFESLVGFDKPTPEETLVFTCAAGIRSVQAAQWAAQAGYSQLVNYKGGASEWFSQ